RCLVLRVQRRQAAIDLRVALMNLGLVEVAQFDGLAKREDVLRAVIARERFADSRLRCLAPDIAKCGQFCGAALACEDGTTRRASSEETRADLRMNRSASPQRSWAATRNRILEYLRRRRRRLPRAAARV